MKHSMKPSHPGAILREDILKEMDISISQAAENLQVSRSRLSAIVNESSGINADMAVRLEKAFGIDAKFWLDLQSRYDLWRIKNSKKIPRIHRITA